MKRRIHLSAFLLLAVFAAGCQSVQNILKSGRPELAYEHGKKFYEKKKWNKAAMLFEAAAPYYIATPQQDSISFMYAYCKFRNREYGVAGSELDLFRRNFPHSVFLEEAEALLAQCYFFMAPEPTKDQSMTVQAIVASNEYLEHYPEGAYVDEFRTVDSVLTDRLHDKAYLDAYTYYKIRRYKSAIVAFKNALKRYPQTKHREQIMYLIVESSYELAANSVASKQTDRYLSMLDSYYTFLAEFPGSGHMRGLERMAENAKEYLEKNKKTDS